MRTPPSGHILQLPAGVDLLQVLRTIAIGRSVVTDSVRVRPSQIKLTVTVPLSGLTVFDRSLSYMLVWLTVIGGRRQPLLTGGG
jgi:hypothetical protein